MRRSNLYLAIAIIGFTLALLTQYNSQNQELANTIYLATVYAIGLLYLYSELRYYRSHSAIIASSQFILIPGSLLILSNFLAPEAWDGTVLDFSIDNSLLSLHTQSTLTSTLILVPMVIFLNLMSKYYQKRYSGFVIRRTIYGPVKIPFLIHVITLIGLYLSTQNTGTLDFVLLLFFIWSIVMVVNYLIVPVLRSPGEQTDTRARTEYMEGILSRPRLRSERPSARSDATPTNQPRRRSGDIPTSSRSGTRSVSTAPSGGYRNISSRNAREESSTRSSSNSEPRRSLSSSSPSNRPSNESRRSRSDQNRSSVAEIDEGITVGAKPREVVANLSGKGKKYLPSGVVTRDDLKCIVCYQDFIKSSQALSICPYCMFPAHKSELSMWLTSSESCPRCNKNLVNGSSKSLITIKESDYCKIRDSV